ncbi:MAG TPA: hypothetical protein VFM18_06085, partial [Methanosarcina sp.]|nr:hypothetical protein [Methanosarcina sp.]
MLRRAGDILQLQFGLSLLFASISCGLSSVALADLLADTSAEINYEIALPADGSAGNPLPLAAHWNCGEKSGGYTPAYQLELLRQGKHLLPWFYFSRPDEFKLPDSYYEKPIKAMAALNLPISFVGTQFEYRLTEKKQFLALPQNLNPNLINQSGQLEKVLTPTADKGAWFDAGSEWSRTVIFKKIQRWYPNPPLVLFVSNNEQEKLSGRDI